MKKFAITFMAVLALLLSVGIVAAQGGPTPSTNDANRLVGWAHVDEVSQGLGEVTLDFISTRNFNSCFEYRSDGDTSQTISDTNENVAITDGLYPYYCVNNSTNRQTLTADEYVEVRMVFGAETDERFDWTRFDVIPVPQPIRAKVCLTGSDNSQLTPGQSKYQFPPSGSVAYFGQGTEAGCLYHDFPAGTTNVTVWTSYNNTSSQPLTQDISVDPVFDFSTNKVTLKLNTCSNAPLSGGSGRMKVGSTTVFFPSPNLTAADGKISAELFPGTYDFEMKYNGTAEWKNAVTIPDADYEIGWTTTKVTLNWAGQISYGGPAGDFTWFNKPSMEMMPGTVKFHFRPVGGHPGYTADLPVSGCIYTGGYITLVDEVGNPIANYPADYPAENRNLRIKHRCGGSWSASTSFQTDAYGQTPYNVSCSNWDKKITMSLNQTAKEQDVTVNPVFQAAKVNVNLMSCTAPITATPGGTVAQGGGFWYTHGTTGPSGTMSFYAFPGKVKVRMNYNHQSVSRNEVIVAGTNDVDYQTTQVTLAYPGDIKSNMGGSWWMFSKPSMDLLPGNYNFWFKNGSSWMGPVPIDVSGCEVNKGYVLLKVKDETGAGVAGGEATPAYGGAWGATLPGTTDANGNLFAEIPPGYTKIRMTVNQGGQEQTLAQLAASNYTWTTQVFRIWLNNHSGAAITDQQGILMQGGGIWVTWGNLNASGYRDVQLFPGSYRFKMNYKGTGETRSGIPVSLNPGIENYAFQTGQVFGSCITQYSDGVWATFTDGMELMPGSYTFRYPPQTGVVVGGGTTNLTCP